MLRVGCGRQKNKHFSVVTGPPTRSVWGRLVTVAGDTLFVGFAPCSSWQTVVSDRRHDQEHNEL